VTGAAFFLLALMVVAAAGDWLAVAQERKPLEYVCKPLTLGLLIAAALALDPDHGDVRAWFVAALVLSLIGDVFLMLPDRLFVAGLSAFLLAHIAYIVGLNLVGVEAIPFLVGIVVGMAVVLSVGRRVVDAVRSGPDPKLAGPVVAYIFVISAMLASAIGTAQPAAIAGAALFCSSDALIAWNRFIAPTRRSPLVIIVTYHLAQLLLVLSLL
jgi:uncharacterized membrane protein YhhN